MEIAGQDVVRAHIARGDALYAPRGSGQSQAGFVSRRDRTGLLPLLSPAANSCALMMTARGLAKFAAAVVELIGPLRRSWHGFEEIEARTVAGNRMTSAKMVKGVDQAPVTVSIMKLLGRKLSWARETRASTS